MSLEAMETEQRCEELWKASEIALAEKRRQQLALDWILVEALSNKRPALTARGSLSH